MRSRVQPTRVRGDGIHTDYTESHPAYGMIGAHSISATPGTPLAGSDFRHGHYVVIRVNEAVLHRGLSHDYWGARRQVVEVALSEAQWASFVSSMNRGDGVPCTIQWTATEGDVPGIDLVSDRITQARSEVSATFTDALAGLKDIRATYARGERPSTKDIRDGIDAAIREIEANIPFVMKSFDEHMETTVEKARIEANAFVTAAIARAGITALGGTPVEAIEEGER